MNALHLTVKGASTGSFDLAPSTMARVSTRPASQAEAIPVLCQREFFRDAAGRCKGHHLSRRYHKYRRTLTAAYSMDGFFHRLRPPVVRTCRKFLRAAARRGFENRVDKRWGPKTPKITKSVGGPLQPAGNRLETTNRLLCWWMDRASTRHGFVKMDPR